MTGNKMTDLVKRVSHPPSRFIEECSPKKQPRIKGKQKKNRQKSL
jgi:hypothetical protein